jgi:hypothetical protein
VPYLLERRNEPLPVALSAQRADTVPADLASAAGHSRTTYRIQFPYAHLPGARLALETSARVFQRGVQLGAERAADRHRRDRWVEVIALGTWAHAAQDTAAPALILPLPSIDRTDLLLTVDEGDNSPLPLTGVKLLLPSYRLRFFRPPGAALRVVYGNKQAMPPQYDLALLAPQVMGVEAREIAPGPETVVAAQTPAVLVSPGLFWAILGISVVVLIGVVARLATTSEARRGES